MNIYYRVYWYKYNTKQRRIERRIRAIWGWSGWESFSASTQKRIPEIISLHRTNWNTDSGKFSSRKSARQINLYRVMCGARPCNPVKIRRIRAAKLDF